MVLSRSVLVLSLVLVFPLQKTKVRKQEESERSSWGWVDYDVLFPKGKPSPGAGSSPARVLLETERVLRKRLQALNGVETRVSILGRRIRVEVKNPTPMRMFRVRRFVGGRNVLELRFLFDEDQGSVNLAVEKAKLKQWLQDPRHLALVEKDPRAVELFNSLPTKEGGPAEGGKIRWAPCAMAWKFPSPPFSCFYVLNGGKKGRLFFAPLRMDVRGFTGKDLKAERVRITRDRYGHPAIAFAMKNDCAEVFSNLTFKFRQHPFAVLVNGFVRSCPVVQMRLPGAGILTGGSKGFQEWEVKAVLGAFQSAPLPAPLVLMDPGVYPGGEKKPPNPGKGRREKPAPSRTRPPSAFRLEGGTGLPGAIRVYKADLPGPVRCFAVYVPWNAGWEIRAVKSRTPSGKEPLTSLAAKWKALVAVNGGYFDMKARPCREVGLLVLDGKIVSPPVQKVTVHGKPVWVSRAAAGFFEGGKTEFRWVFFLDRKLWALPRPLALPPKPPLRPRPGWKPWSPPWVVQAGPMLLRRGRVFIPRKVERLFAAKDVRHPRTALGTTGRKETVLLVVEGRQKVSRGTTLVETARLLQVLGCREGMNLDGGGSSTLVIRGRLWNLPQGRPVQRPVPSGLVVLPRRRKAQGSGPSRLERKGGKPVSFPEPKKSEPALPVSPASASPRRRFRPKTG